MRLRKSAEFGNAIKDRDSRKRVRKSLLRITIASDKTETAIATIGSVYVQYIFAY
jgi:hypothetical protein